MRKLNFSRARILLSEFQKKYAEFVLGRCYGCIAGSRQKYRCAEFGMSPDRGLVIEISLEPVNKTDDCQDMVDLPETEFVGSCGTIPIRYLFR